MKHLRLFLVIAMALAPLAGAAAQEVPTREALRAEADSRAAGYDFAAALEAYHRLLPEADSAEAVALGARIMCCENGLNLLKFATEPELVASQMVPLTDFYLRYGHLADRTWIPFPNDFVPQGQHPWCNALQFERSRGEIVYPRPDSTGRWDLWTSRLLGDTLWSLPRPLGEAFTSAGDEIYPVLSQDGRQLYFSSNGMAGMGGYDLFVCDRQPDGSWSAPQNVGFPYSSTADDFIFSHTPDGACSVFASTRDCPAGSIRIFVVRREKSPVHMAVTSPEEARRIAAFKKRPEPAAVTDEPAEKPAPEAGRDEMTVRYFRAVDSLERLGRRVAVLSEELSDLRDDYAAEQDPARRQALAQNIASREREQLSAQAAQTRQILAVRRMESGFLSLGQVPPPILKAAPEPQPEEVAAPVSLPAYSFRRMEYGLIGDLAVEMPPIEEPPFDYTFKIGTVAVFAPENKRPDGLLYQIQICATAAPLPISRLKGMSPCFEMKQGNGKYIYFVGAFRSYDEAVNALPKVKARGFSSAFITARNNGKAITVKNARALEPKRK